MQAVSELTGKDFNYPKRHRKCHVIDDIYNMGVVRNSSTRPNEGVHQEVRATWQQFNKKNMVAQVRLSRLCTSPRLTRTLKQVTRGDANQEAVARMRMLLKDYDDAVAEEVKRLDKEPSDRNPSTTPSDIEEDGPDSDEAGETGADSPSDESVTNYELRSAARRFTTSDDVEVELASKRPIFAGFDRKLRQFIAKYVDASVGHDTIKVRAT
jgi:hypothetical protein